MQADCIGCHNNDTNSTKRNWNVGDVGGVLEIIRPLDDKVAQARARLKWLFAIPISITVLVLAVAGVFSFSQRLRRRRPT